MKKLGLIIVGLLASFLAISYAYPVVGFAIACFFLIIFCICTFVWFWMDGTSAEVLSVKSKSAQKFRCERAEVFRGIDRAREIAEEFRRYVKYFDVARCSRCGGAHFELLKVTRTGESIHCICTSCKKTQLAKANHSEEAVEAANLCRELEELLFIDPFNEDLSEYVEFSVSE